MRRGKFFLLMLSSVLPKEKFYSRGFVLISISCRGSEFRAGLLASVLTFSCTWVSFLFWV